MPRYEDEEQLFKHPAFGQISVSVVNGRTNLFQVDYPQQHFITLRIRKADLHRRLSHDWIFGQEEIVEVEMSEVQWARLISSPNTEGVPCTLAHYRDPKTGERLEPRLEDNYTATVETFAKEVDKTAKKAATELKQALQMAEDLLAGGPVKKGDLQKLKEMLYFANMHLDSNLGFVVQQAEEAIEKAAENAKTEVNAHIDYSLQRLGQLALGEKLEEAIAAGVDPKLVGQRVADAVGESE